MAINAAWTMVSECEVYFCVESVGEGEIVLTIHDEEGGAVAYLTQSEVDDLVGMLLRAEVANGRKDGTA